MGAITDEPVPGLSLSPGPGVDVRSGNGSGADTHELPVPLLALPAV